MEVSALVLRLNASIPSAVVNRALLGAFVLLGYRNPTYVHGSMDAGGNLGSAAKGLAIDLKVAGSGPVSCHFLIPFFSLPCVVL